MEMSRLKSGDLVAVVSGAEKGKRGKVLKVDRRQGRITVQGVNMVYKHLRKSQKHPQGGRIQLEAALAISNVLLVDPKSGKPTRVRMQVDGDGKKVRVSVKSGEPV
ncbi:MAG TPA: 50S ribosomal protein L24 [Planctomycetes bacterium]|nr:50S ribosomal protein L24 [Planctomycetota bacterium]